MKTKQLLGMIMLFFLTITLLSCNQVSQKKNGWYTILDGQQDSISKEPIVVVKDFETVEMDSDSFGRAMIVGKIKKEKVDKWADATEKAVGKRIGFVFNNKVITNPQVNMRIESGNFLITNPFGDDLTEIYKELLKEMNEPSED